MPHKGIQRHQSLGDVKASSYLTVAIPYVNADPHLGYAYELVLADIHARAQRLEGVPTRFLGGTDDYSLKNVLAAEQAGVPIRQFVDAHARRFEALIEPLDLSFDDFIRTSADARHIPAVHRLWNAALDSGDLYKRPYEGDYCIGCETFYSTDELREGRCPEHQTPLERVVEENWFFRLSRYQDLLEELVTSGRLHISPEPFRNEVLSFIRAGLDDISVSRSRDRARGWGVPVPNDDGQVIYVWFDALTNYISALNYGESGDELYRRWWIESQRRTHVIGKGILRFHAVYWPAFLLSAGEPLPTHIRVHPYLTLGQLKLSKSSGTRVDPIHIATRYGADALRWWFARDVGEVADTDFTVDRLVTRANEDLAGGIGNVINRIVTLVHRYRSGYISGVESPAIGGFDGLAQRVRRYIRDFELRRAAQEVIDAVGLLNQDLERTQPWVLAKDASTTDELDRVLAHQIDAARAIADAVEPITPALAARARAQLTGKPLPPSEPLVRKIEDQTGANEKAQ